MCLMKMCIVFLTVAIGICTKTILAHNRGISERIIRGIPIHPFDPSTIRHLTRRPTPFNYDAELVHLPHNAKTKLQIMERISVPVDTNYGYTHKHNNKPKSMEHNQNNFDAYMIPPYQLTTIMPAIHQLARTPNQTDFFRYVVEPVLKYPSRNVAKQLQPNNSMNRFNRMPIEFDKQDFYRSLVKYEEQQNAMGRQRIAQPTFVKSSGKYYRNNKAPAIGIENFHSHQQYKPYPSVTYVPTYAEQYKSGQRFEDVEPANSHVYAQRLEMLQNEELPPLTTTTAPTFAPTIIPTRIIERESSIEFIKPKNASKKETKTNRTVHADKLKLHPDLITAPEMFKFTINDAILRPQGKQAIRSYDGPVTLTPPSIPLPLKPRQQQHHFNHNDDKQAIDSPNEMNSMQSTQTIRRIPIRTRDQPMYQHNAKFSGQHQMYRQPQSHMPPNESNNNEYRWLNELQYQQIPLGVSSSSSSSSSRRQIHRPSSNEPIIMSTQMTVTGEKSDGVEPQLINELTTMDSKRTEKRLRRRRPNDERRTDGGKSGSIITVTPIAPLLEFSNSYTNRRTQGYNSAEEILTTPIPVKLKNARSQLNESDHSTSGNSEKRQQQNRRQRVSTTTATTTTNDVNEPKRSEDARYFQDIYMEQLTPHQIDLGHLSENPSGWEERYERKNMKSQRYLGKVKWGDKIGNFGEHYYDLNHINAKSTNETDQLK